MQSSDMEMALWMLGLRIHILTSIITPLALTVAGDCSVLGNHPVAGDCSVLGIRTR